MRDHAPSLFSNSFPHTSLPPKKPHTVGVKRLAIRSVIGWLLGNFWRRMSRPGSLKNYFLHSCSTMKNLYFEHFIFSESSWAWHFCPPFFILLFWLQRHQQPRQVSSRCSCVFYDWIHEISLRHLLFVCCCEVSLLCFLSTWWHAGLIYDMKSLLFLRT